MLNRDLTENATTKATLGATQETALLLLDLSEPHRYTHFWLACTPPPEHEPDDGDEEDYAGDGGTCDDDDSCDQQFSSRMRTATATDICLGVTESLDELAKSQAVEHKDEPR